MMLQLLVCLIIEYIYMPGLPYRWDWTLKTKRCGVLECRATGNPHPAPRPTSAHTAPTAPPSLPTSRITSGRTRGRSLSNVLTVLSASLRKGACDRICGLTREKSHTPVLTVQNVLPESVFSILIFSLITCRKSVFLNHMQFHVTTA